jgi:hypothetical protein
MGDVGGGGVEAGDAGEQAGAGDGKSGDHAAIERRRTSTAPQENRESFT